MKKLLTTILIVLNFVGVNANPENFFNKLANSQTSIEINSIIEKSWIGSYVLRIDREIENNYRQEIHRFDYRYESKYKTFQINLITKNDKIVYGQILQFHWKNTIEKEKEFIVKENQLKELVSLFNEIYLTELEPQEFITELNSIIEYSFGCGIDASYKPKEAKKILSWIRARNKKKMIKWLIKPNPEFQCYAVFGLNELKNKGIELNTDERRIMNYVISKNYLIQNCSGCLGGLKTSLIELIGLKE